MNFDRTPQPARPGAASPSGLKRLLGVLLRLGVLAVAFVIMLFALVLGMFLALGIVAWALVRGRRPVPGVFRAYYQRARNRQTPAEKFVVDVDVVEVPEPGGLKPEAPRAQTDPG